MKILELPYVLVPWDLDSLSKCCSPVPLGRRACSSYLVSPTSDFLWFFNNMYKLKRIDRPPPPFHHLKTPRNGKRDPAGGRWGENTHRAKVSRHCHLPPSKTPQFYILVHRKKENTFHFRNIRITEQLSGF